MGLFDYIGKKMREAGEEAQKAQMEAENWSVERICISLQRTSSMAKCTGYGKILREKCQQMDDYELKRLFDRVLYDGNIKACNLMMSVMQSRGLAYRENGKIIKTY